MPSAARPATCCWKVSTPTPRRSSATRRVSTSWRSRASWICAATSSSAPAAARRCSPAGARACRRAASTSATAPRCARSPATSMPSTCSSPTAKSCRRRTSCSPSAWKAIRASSARPAKTWSACQYQLDDPKEFRDETILVVGAGDSAIENALALAEQNDVWIINRGKEFSRAKDANLSAVVAAIADQRRRLNCYYEASIKSVVAGAPGAPPLTRRGADRDRREDRRMPPHHRAARRDSAAQVRRVGRHQVSERAQRRHPGAVAPLREQRARRVRHRLARRLPADQAGDEPGLRRRRVHQRQRPQARRSPAARIPVPRPAVRAAGRRDGRALPDADPDVPADERACSSAS